VFDGSWEIACGLDSALIPTGSDLTTITTTTMDWNKDVAGVGSRVLVGR
jgi:hypothetical protein